MLTGQCVCGRVHIELHGPRPAGVVVCHCLYCQLISGSAFCASALVKESDVKLSGEMKEYAVTAASGNPVVHKSCANCSNTFAHTSAAFEGSVAIHVTYVRELATLPVVKEVFVRTRWPHLSSIGGATQAQTMV